MDKVFCDGGCIISVSIYFVIVIIVGTLASILTLLTVGVN